MSKYLAKLKALQALREKNAFPGNCQNCQNPGKLGFDSFDSTYGSRFLQPERPPTEAGEAHTTGCAHVGTRALEGLDIEDQAHRGRLEERAAILEFEESLPRAEAEAIAHREMAAGIYETAQAERDPTPYASTLAILRAKCPAYVPEDRWHQAITDAATFISKWGAEAQAFGWAARELFGLHPVPEHPTANYSRLSRLDGLGLIWLLRGRRKGREDVRFHHVSMFSRHRQR
jgi:hypothetical protein